MVGGGGVIFVVGGGGVSFVVGGGGTIFVVGGGVVNDEVDVVVCVVVVIGVGMERGVGIEVDKGECSNDEVGKDEDGFAGG